MYSFEKCKAMDLAKTALTARGIEEKEAESYKESLEQRSKPMC